MLAYDYGRSSTETNGLSGLVNLYFANDRVFPVLSGTRSEYSREQEELISSVLDGIFYRPNTVISNGTSLKLIDNITRLMDIKNEWPKSGNTEVPGKVIDVLSVMLINLIVQPTIFPTNRKSIQLEYEKADRSYLEFEVFEDKTTCMMIPKRDYDKAVFPEPGHNDYVSMNKIIGEFYDITRDGQ